MERWIVFAIFSMIFAGITSVLAKFGMKGLSSDTALAVRTAVVFGLVVLNAFIFRDVMKELKSSPTSNILFLTLSALTTTLSWIFYYKAMKEGQVSVVASIDKASIVVTIILSFLILQEPITPKLLIGGSLILSGMLVLIIK